jgi:hypothetical protein
MMVGRRTSKKAVPGLPGLSEHYFQTMASMYSDDDLSKLHPPVPPTTIAAIAAARAHSTTLAAPPRMRKKGGGRKPILTSDEITRGREIFCRELAADPRLWKGRAAEVARLRPLLKLKRKVGDDTLLRHIIRPVLGLK